MTFVGHSLTGAALAVLAAPRQMSRKGKALLMACFVLLANVPDYRLPSWGHDDYQVSHSVFVNLLLILALALALCLWPRAGKTVGGVRVFVLGGLAWLSHPLLDSFYNHGQGIAIFWPFSPVRLALPIPWFDTVRKPLPHVDAHTVGVWAIELVFYGCLLVLAVVLRKILSAQRGVGRPAQPTDRSLLRGR